MSSSLLRPGVAFGRYPQKKESSPGVLERLIVGTFGNAKQLLNSRKFKVNYIASRVNRHASKLQGLSDNAMDEHIVKLRGKLVRTGLTEELIALSFATVRELSERTLGKRHFDVQLLGGWVMMNGMVAEMETGQGKTLTSTLASCTAALAGIPAHVITANDYLASRDAELLEPLYDCLGLTVAAVVEGMEADDRRNSYACNIVHTTNKQIAFDYLRDRMEIGDNVGSLSFQFKQIQREQQQGSPQLLLRGLCFAIVDEADSVLIDEARTPLIISRTRPNAEQEQTYRQALDLADSLKQGVDYLTSQRDSQISLTETGQKRLSQLTASLSYLWAERRRREFLVKQALTASYLFQRDKHYLVRDGKIQIVDQHTGRVMADRSWEQGLHQMIEVREGCEITDQKEPLAKISYQRFFRRYLKLAGMSGTVKDVTSEFWSAYGLRVVKVPTHQRSKRRMLPEHVYTTAEQKWQALIRCVKAQNIIGRPVLIGTSSVAESEFVSDLLFSKGFDHCILNARQDKDEAEIISRAGQLGQITVATNMAGRGTDIQLGPGVTERGGLHVVATSRNEARRIDRQLYGRCARQGDPGSTEAFLSLQDKTIALYYPSAMLQVWASIWPIGKPLPKLFGKIILRLPQQRIERQHRLLRRRMLKMDEEMSRTLAFTGKSE